MARPLRIEFKDLTPLLHSFEPSVRYSTSHSHSPLAERAKNFMEKQVTENQKQWEIFAQKDPFFYVDTTAKNPSQFWKKGEDNFKTYILPILQKYHIAKKICVDFGCGIGRHTFPLAEYFQMVYGVDVSENMLKLATSSSHERDINNVQFIQNNIFFSLTKSVDFIYCVNVFQHIEDIKFIESILKNLSHQIHGFAYLQFDTRPQSLLYRLKKIIPDFLLPKSQRRGIRRIRRNTQEIEYLIKRIGFSIIEQQRPCTEHHFFLLKRL